MSVPTPVTYGLPEAVVDTFQEHRMSTQAYVLIIEALRQAIAEAGLKLLNEIDVQTALSNAGYEVAGARLLFFFHPNLVVRVLQHDWTAMAEAPLKLVVFEQPGGTTVIRWINPSVAFTHYNNPVLSAFGQELADTVAKLVDAALAFLSA